MAISPAHSISAIAALIQAAQVARPANRPGDGPYFGSPADAPAKAPPPVDPPKGQTTISRLDLAAAGAQQPSISAAGLAAYAESEAA